MNLAKYIKQRRLELDITQAELGKLSDVKQPTISEIEKGNVAITLRTLNKLAKGLEAILVIGFKSNYEEEEEIIINFD